MSAFPQALAKPANSQRAVSRGAEICAVDVVIVRGHSSN